MRGLMKIMAAALLLGLTPVSVSAQEDLPRIESRQVTAMVHADRSVTVQEEVVLQLQDNEPETFYVKPQVRDEKVTLQDLQVQGEGVELEIDEDYSILTVNANQTSATVRYQMSYTLQYYQDNDPQQDQLTWMLSDPLIGYLTTESLSVQLTMEESLQRDNWRLDCGYSSDGSCRYGQGRWNEGVFTFVSDQPTEESDVVLQVTLQEGAFAQAPQYEYPLVIHRLQLSIEVLENLDLKVHREMTMTFHDRESEWDLDLFFNSLSSDCELLDVTINDPNLEISRYGYLHLENPPEQMTLNMDYTIRLDEIPRDLYLNLTDPYSGGLIEQLDVTIRMPQATEFEVNCYDGLYEDLDTVTVQSEEDGKVLSITNSAPISDLDRVTVTVPLPSQMLRSSDALSFWSMFACGMVLACAAFALVQRGKTAGASGELPSGVNPLQARLFIDQSCTVQDVALVMVNWVARGHLRVRMESYGLRLMRGKPLIHQPRWEKDLMDALFKEEDNEVISGALGTEFASAMNTALRQARQERKGYFPPSLKGIMVFFHGLCLLPLAAMLVLCTAALGMDGGLIAISLFQLIWTGVTAALMGRRTADRKTVVRRLGRGVALVVWLALFASLYSGYGVYRLYVSVGEAGALISLLLLYRHAPLNAQGQRLRAQVRQWRQSLLRMPNQRLDTLAAREPNYAYRAYGYACALDLHEIWEQRFYELIVPPLDSVTDEAGNPQSLVVMDELAGAFRDLTRPPLM